MRLGLALTLGFLCLGAPATAGGFRWKIGSKEVARYHHLFDFEVDDGGPELTAPRVLLLRGDHFRQGRYRAKATGLGGLILEQVLSFRRAEKEEGRLVIEERYLSGGWRLRVSGAVEARLKASKVEVEGKLTLESEPGSRFQLSDAELSWTSVFNPQSSALQAAEYELSAQVLMPGGKRGVIEGSGGIAFVFLGSAAMHRKLAPRFDERFKRGRAGDTARDIGKNSEGDNNDDEEDDAGKPAAPREPKPKQPEGEGDEDDGDEDDGDEGFDGGLAGGGEMGGEDGARDPLPLSPRAGPRPEDPGPKGLSPKQERALARKINRAIVKASTFLAAGGGGGMAPLGKASGELSSYALAHAGGGYGGQPGVVDTAAGKAVYIASLRILSITAAAAVAEASNRPLRPRYRLKAVDDSTRQALQAHVDTLLAMRQPRTGIWGYKAGSVEWDHSNTQFAVQALYAARCCGAKVKADVWKDIFNHFAKTQRKQGRQRAIAVVMPPDQTTIGAGQKEDERELVERVTWRAPGGWRYCVLRRYPISGSMTTGGLMSLTLAYRALKEEGALPSAWEARFRSKRDHALAWIGQRLQFSSNPNEGRWHFYYLFGLEKAMDALGVETIAGKDWYVEGAQYLLACQQEDGGWSPAPEANEQGLLDRSHVTAFALLFLSRAFLPFGARQPTGGVRPPRAEPEGTTTPRSLLEPQGEREQERESQTEPIAVQPRPAR